MQSPAMFTIIGSDGKEYGPVTAQQLRQWIAENRLNRTMQAKREGETVWQEIGSFPEFAENSTTAATEALPPPLAAAPAPAAGTDPTPGAPAPTAPEAFAFSGNWQEYFKIWIVNLLLTVVTFGIYAAWAKVRKRRYFYANTRLFGHSFEYLADPQKILIGNLVVGGSFMLLAFSQTISPFLYLALALALAIVVPLLIVRALAFNARNTAWRGLRFHFAGRYGEAVKWFLLFPLLVVPTLGLIIPWIARKQKTFIIGYHRFGTSPFTLGGDTGGFYKIYGFTALFFLPVIGLYVSLIAVLITAGIKQAGQPKGPPPIDPAAMGVIGLLFFIAVPIALLGAIYFRARMFNYLWNHTDLAGHRFTATMRARELLRLQLVNTLATAFTFGLMHPWSAVRTVEYQLASLRVVPAGNLDHFVAAAQPPVSAIGEAAGDFFDFDIGFGV